MTTAWRVAIGIAVLGGLVFGVLALPPPYREISIALGKAIVIAVAAYVVFVALNMRGNT